MNIQIETYCRIIKKKTITWPAIRYRLLDRRLKFNEMKYFDVVKIEMKSFVQSNGTYGSCIKHII